MFSQKYDSLTRSIFNGNPISKREKNLAFEGLHRYPKTFIFPASVVLAIDAKKGLVDSSQSEHQITNNGATIFDNEVLNWRHTASVIEFNGASEYLSVPASEDFIFSDDFTIMAWVKLKTNSSGVIIGGNNWEIYWEPSLNIGWRLYCNGSARLAENSAVLADEWEHIAITRLGSVCKLYINGSIIDTNPSFSDSFGNSINLISVGYWVHLGINYLDGKLANILIDKEALDIPTLWAEGKLYNLEDAYRYN